MDQPYHMGHEFQTAHANGYVSVNPLGDEPPCTIYDKDAQDGATANLTTERFFPGTFKGVRNAMAKERLASRAGRKAVGTPGKYLLQSQPCLGRLCV